MEVEHAAGLLGRKDGWVEGKESGEGKDESRTCRWLVVKG